MGSVKQLQAQQDGAAGVAFEADFPCDLREGSLCFIECPGDGCGHTETPQWLPLLQGHTTQVQLWMSPATKYQSLSVLGTSPLTTDTHKAEFSLSPESPKADS